MKKFSKEDLDSLDRIYRLNLINSITGIKPANLIGTKSADGFENLAIISSVIHLGSNPPIIGFVMRPSYKVRRDTYENILTSKSYTINAVQNDLVERAHYTSAKFDVEVSEFEKCHLTPLYEESCFAPFVAESSLKFEMKLIEILDIKSNGTKMIVGEVMQILLDSKALEANGQLDLEQLEIAGVSGLNSYYDLKKRASFPYARPSEIPNWD